MSDAIFAFIGMWETAALIGAVLFLFWGRGVESLPVSARMLRRFEQVFILGWVVVVVVFLLVLFLSGG